MKGWKLTLIKWSYPAVMVLFTGLMLSTRQWHLAVLFGAFAICDLLRWFYEIKLFKDGR